MTKMEDAYLPGWGLKGDVQKWVDEMSCMEDLDPENFTDEEREKVKAVKGGVLEALGLDEEPSDYRAFMFRKAGLVRFLRGRNGNTKKTIKMLVDCIKWMDEYGFIEKMREYEEKYDTPEYQEMEAKFKKYFCCGFHGKDKRGAACLYFRYGNLDLKGLVKQTSFEFYIQRELYGTGYFWSKLYNESLLQKKWLLGRFFVIDLKGFSWRRVMNILSVGRKLAPVMVDHFPEGASTIAVINAPWYFASIWAMVSPLLPARTREKKSMFFEITIYNSLKNL